MDHIPSRSGGYMIARIVQSYIDSIDSRAITSFRHPVPYKETTISAKTLPLTPHKCRVFADLYVTDWMSEIPIQSADDHHTCLEAHRPAVRSGIYCGYSNFTRSNDESFWTRWDNCSSPRDAGELTAQMQRLWQSSTFIDATPTAK
ncbi:hypothetical protein TNCV_2362631 [Trichonephila clavipes]|nr:hypothetical protein TNCV_2362631 [Trichonephila clavipes]